MCIRDRIYVNDLSNAIAYADVNLFADDTVLFHNHSTLKSLTKIVNIDLKLIFIRANFSHMNTPKKPTNIPRICSIQRIQHSDRLRL